ncbi:hypothetical protein [Oharaeibacter diazotrophicus]|uniref:Uncharacterized protein n=1 Tax=Oharaeibacter diazotrophicus TaxID=1920512 RepID=A0A4R6R9T2_9HYPH|nr:hypothetical protein [Oharaeibacter diazotrophicus]TDP82694.1 hypothetical protein EDD54_3964 [Oharaeibacter diazotrophicus]BBE72544.1 hypothetical protein OHA_1_02140 [Pleomorphomonas sp. SM30]GLS76575.1 hypothetical protein GCM10007904_19120 [Oharaeibacter diazotrophicus]
MIELVMTVCLLTQPGDCKKERLPFEGSLMTCARSGQFAVAEWIGTHPKWQISRWRCGPSAHDA